MSLFLIVVWAVVFGAIAARMAAAAKRPVPVWVLYGAILGPIALLLLHRAPPGRCHRCESRVRGWGFVCRFCGDDVRGVPARRATTTAVTAGERGREEAPIMSTPATATRAPAAPAPGIAAPEAGSAARHAERLTANTRSVEQSTSVSATDASRPAARTVAAPVPAPVPPPAQPARAPVQPQARGRRRRGREQADPGRTIGAGLFLTGSASLLPGYRYAIAVTDTRLRILGPLDLEPDKVVMDRDLAPFDAVVTEDRVMLTEGSPDRPRMFLVFEGVSGTTPAGLADEIVRAVQAVPRAG